MGAPDAAAPRRARPRPRHADGRRAARGAPACPASATPLERPPRRDQPRPARAPAASARRRAASRSLARRAVRTLPDGPADRRRQRVLRRPAGAPVRARPPTAGASAWSASTRDGALAFGLAPRAGPAPVSAAAPPGARAGSGRSAATAIADALGEPDRPAGRRGARRSTTATPARLRRHPAGGAAATPSSTRSPSRARPTSPPTSISTRSRSAARAAGARTCRADDAGRLPAGARHRSARGGAEARAPRRSGRRDRRRRCHALDRHAAGGMGELFKVFALAHPGLPASPGFARPPPRSMPGREAAMDPRMLIEAPDLSSHAGIRHAFFTREGGVSARASTPRLNGGPGSGDDRGARGREPRAAWRRQLGVAPKSAGQPAPGAFARRARRRASPGRAERPRADAMVTRAPGVALGVAHRRLRPRALRRPQARRHRRGSCRLARRARRRARGAPSPRWSGSAPSAAASSRCSARRSASAAYEVGPEFVAQFREPRTRATRASSRRRTRRATPCSTCPASSARGSRRPASASHEILGLCTYCRGGALLQLPPRRPTAASRTTAG